MNLAALLAELDPMERAIHVQALRRRAFAPFVATMLVGTFLLGLVPTVLLAATIAGIVYGVARRRLARELIDARSREAHAITAGC